MARIRSIKPELLEDERTARLSHVEWRLFVSLLLLADDYGNLRAAPERIHGAALWAHPREDLAKALEGLAAAGLVVLYIVGGQAYAHINGWDKHQKVDHPGKPLCPGVTEGSRIPRESLATTSEGLAPDQDQEIDQDQDQERADSRDPREDLARVWPAGEWLKRYGRAWADQYDQLAYGQAGDSRACASLGDVLDRLPVADRISAQAKALEMFAEFLATPDNRSSGRRHPFSFFVQEWGGLRAPKKPTAKAESFAERDARIVRERAEKDRLGTEATVKTTTEKLARDRTFTPPTPEQQEEIRRSLAGLAESKAVA